MTNQGDFLSHLLNTVMALCAAGGMALCQPAAMAQTAPEQATPPDVNTSAEPAPPPAQPKTKGVTRPPRPRPSPPDQREVYPPAALAEGREGIVGFTLHIDERGRPTQCDITSSSGHADLDTTTCTVLMERARFDPALDNGISVPSIYSNRVRWELPKDALPISAAPAPSAEPKSAVPPSPPPKPIGPTRPVKPKGNLGTWAPFEDYPRGPLRDGIEGTVVFTLTVAADGRPTSCIITQSSGNAELDAAACKSVMKRARFVPAMENGVAKPARYSNRVRWVIPTE